MRFLSLIPLLVVLFAPALAWAQCTLTLECGGGYGTRSKDFSDRSSCEAELRKTQDWLRSVGGGCTITNACTCRRSREPSYTPPSYDYEAERLRQEEAERQRQRGLEEQRKREEEEARRKQEEFERGRDEALKSMKGVSSGDTGLKGADTIKDRSTPAFQLKGAGDTGIKDIPPGKETRDVSTAWKQLHCAAEISGYAISAANKKDGDIDLSEVRYLAEEAIKALSGQALGVKCSDAPPPPKPYGQKGLDSGKLLPFFKTLLDSTARQAEKVNAANMEITELKNKERQTKERIEALEKESDELKAQRPGKAAKGDAIDRAYEEQKAYQEKERQRIEEVYKKQKENQSAMEEAMAALREAQRLINQKNSERDRTLNQINAYQDIAGKALADPEKIPEFQKKIK